MNKKLDGVLRSICRAHIAVAGLVGLWAGNASGLIFFSTGAPDYNTNPPGGTLTNSGWQYQGQWGVYLGTPIAPRYFITAHHVHGVVGDPFIFAGQTYTTLALYDDPNSDLRIWRVCGTFPFHAPLYTNQNEAGAALVVFGRGTQRGSPVTVNSVVKGWVWGGSDNVQRWGENQVGDIVNGGPGVGDLLQVPFDSDGGSNEVHLSIGDSGGGVFLKNGANWQLAGINFSVDGPYNTSTNGSGFNAAIFDEGGLYARSGTNWVFVQDRPRTQPGAFYATRIASHISWITSILNQAPPPDPPPVLQTASIVTGPYLDDVNAVVDANAKTITVPRTTQNQFFRLRACSSIQITNLTLSPQSVVIHFL